MTMEEQKPNKHLIIQGKVGIGIKDPDAALHVDGDIKYTGFLLNDIVTLNNIGIGLTGPQVQLHINTLINHSFLFQVPLLK